MKQSLKGKIALITGASSGIGKACAEQFATLGINLILTARRIDKIEQLAKELKKHHAIDVLPIQVDIQKREQVVKSIESLQHPWNEIDILLNNAGLALTTDLIHEGNLDNWDTMIDTNFRGLLTMTRSILPGMIARQRGHIVNIGSTAAHECYLGGNIYSATKHAVRAISKSLRIDLLGKGIRVSEIDPGLVETEFSEVRWQDKKRAKEFYTGLTPLVANDIADAVVYCVTRPEHVDIAEIVIYPTEQASPNHVYRKEKSAKGVFEG